jgi:DNA-binding transcriptional regulator YiaG
MNTNTSNNGTATARLKRVQNSIGLSNSQMAQLLHTSSRTIAKWVQSGHGEFRAEQRRRLVQLDLIAALAAKVYTKEGARQFFTTPLARFGDKSATDLMLEGNFNSVAGVIAADYEGVRMLKTINQNEMFQ